MPTKKKQENKDLEILLVLAFVSDNSCEHLQIIVTCEFVVFFCHIIVGFLCVLAGYFLHL
jgi:hypothetical protein